MRKSIKYAVIGINHGHIHGMILHMQNAGAEFKLWFAEEPDLSASFAKQYDTVRKAEHIDEILEDPTIDLILSASIAFERAPLAIRAMRHGKDFMADKPGITSLAMLEQVKKVQDETKRIYSVCYSEYFDSCSTIRAADLVMDGAIGKVVQTIGLGPHRTRPAGRPGWFFEKEKYGGILCDIGSHQAAQFLVFTDSKKAEVLHSQVANYRYPQYPGLEDFGEMNLKGDGGLGYVRLDWYTPEGLSTWGDGRLVILGTEGYIEIRKYVDIAREKSGDHLFVVDQKGEHYIDASGYPTPYGKNLVSDILNRTQTHMSQERTFLATQLALEAQANSTRLGNLE